MITNFIDNKNDYNVFTSYINQIFNLLYTSKLPSMNICTNDVILGWQYRWFSFNIYTPDIPADSAVIGINCSGNMVQIDPMNTKNTVLHNSYYPEYYYDIPTTILSAVTHEMSHAEQDIDFFRYGQPGFEDYTDMVENANHYRTIKFLLEHKEFLENNIYFGNDRLHINEQQLLYDYNKLSFAANDFVHKEKKKSLFDKLLLLEIAKTPEQINYIKNIKNFAIKDPNNKIAFIKYKNKYITSQNTLWCLNSFLYRIYHQRFPNWSFAVTSSTEDTIVLQTNIPIL